VGPLFYYELVRLARRGRSTVLRCAYALALLAALYFAYRAQFPHHDPFAAPFTSAPAVPASQLASLAPGFVMAILWVQTLAAFVLTPAYVAGVIAEEKERHTLDMLLTTHLRGREIVVGKLAARLTHLAGVLLTGLPLLALTQLWGGVDILVLLAAFALTGLILLGVGTLSALYSVYARTVRQALAWCYPAVAFLFLVSLAAPGATPPALFAMMNQLGQWTFHDFRGVLVCAAGLAVGTLVALRIAVVRLRAVASAQAGDPSAGKPAPPVAEQPKEDAKAARRRIAPPPVRDHPLLWRETSRSGWSNLAREFEYGARKDWPAALALLLFIFGIFGMYSYSKDWRWHFEILSGATRMAVICTAGVWCAGTALRAAGSVSLERDQHTLDALLTMPCSREAIAGAKWLGSILRGREFGYALGLVAVLGLVNGTLHPAALLLVTVAVLTQLSFWAGVGLWLSVTCRTTLRARVTTALALMIFAWFWAELLVYLDGWRKPDSFPNLAVALNPVQSLWILTFGWRSVESADGAAAQMSGAHLAETAAGTLAYALCAGLLWLAACRRFRKA
jgi:ABC-type transport system involved in multi-copper enzyme maturation permease subunit